MIEIIREYANWNSPLLSIYLKRREEVSQLTNIGIIHLNFIDHLYFYILVFYLEKIKAKITKDILYDKIEFKIVENAILTSNTDQDVEFIIEVFKRYFVDIINNKIKLRRTALDEAYRLIS